MTAIRILTLLVCVCLTASQAAAKDIYVAANGSDTNAGSSTAQPLRTIAAASEKARPGDTVYLMPGRYQESLTPVRSGEPGKPITYRSQGPSNAVLTAASKGGLKAAIKITNVSRVVVDGIDVDGVTAGPDAHVDRFAEVSDADNIVIRRGTFRYANGWAGIEIKASSYVTLEDNVIDWVGAWKTDDDHSPGDAIYIEAGNPHHILVQRNSVQHGGHDLLRLDATSSVVQDNYFNNDFRAKYGVDAGYRSVSLNGADNVFQRNVVVLSGLNGRGSSSPLQTAQGLRNIVRRNVYRDAFLEGLVSQSGSWAHNAAYARIYNNTFYKLKAAAWRARMFEESEIVGYNAFVNNLVVDSRLEPQNELFDSDVMFIMGDAGLGPTAGGVVRGNMFGPAGGKAPVVLLEGADGRISISDAEAKYPQLFAKNRAARPKFTNPNPRRLSDFTLQQGSRGIDEGTFLTTAVATAQSSSLRVADSLYFSDGSGLVPGDEIQLEGSKERARVMRIDRDSNTLFLSAPLNFKSGQGVALAYDGNGPDVGAGEGNEETAAPKPPEKIGLE